MKNISVKAITATKLSDKQIDQIRQNVEKKFPDTKVSVDAKIDPSVIGGIKLLVQTVEYDATVRGKLEKLRSHLLENL